jgi:nicotinate phosphoribosyltransferase
VIARLIALAKDKARRLTQAGILYSEFGSRRRRSYDSHRLCIEGLLAGEKEALSSHSGSTGPGKLLGTSNVHFAQMFDLTPIGTVAHEWTMAVAALEGYDYANLRALQYWESIYCPPAFQPQSPADDLTVALTDTFSSKVFFKDLLETPEGRAIGKRWRGLRQDSGDSKVFARKAIEVYKSLGIDPKKKVVVYSDGLHVEKCIELAQFSKEVGIGAGFGESSFGGQEVIHRAWLSLATLLLVRRWHQFHK